MLVEPFRADRKSGSPQVTANRRILPPLCRAGRADPDTFGLSVTGEAGWWSDQRLRVPATVRNDLRHRDEPI
ncbi:hypothetical protein [Micromonospora craniellae]|uniref:hypothetical protein n=1 Tax=Micromonospora craniellae TaxID=2294034 RepID=UPI0011C0E890|nr:hypothetical protein [Micromonospora craniellae]QOC94153.1 hypothetical protein ID554_11430 [Micromonospora craniellae]